MKVTMYLPPYGKVVEVDITNVDQEDAEFFEANNIQISMEQLNDEFIVYADIGLKTEDGEPNEFLELAQGRTCNETLKALRKSCEDILAVTK